mmetsp:Transcript_19895/g.75183  ORF Transcript_19895/g.75183 Transcript_19895/m.75183 type:complete len:211 (-) Transcript_19895:58-690(-)
MPFLPGRFSRRLASASRQRGAWASHSDSPSEQNTFVRVAPRTGCSMSLLTSTRGDVVCTLSRRRQSCIQFITSGTSSGSSACCTSSPVDCDGARCWRSPPSSTRAGPRRKYSWLMLSRRCCWTSSQADEHTVGGFVAVLMAWRRCSRTSVDAYSTSRRSASATLSSSSRPLPNIAGPLAHRTSSLCVATSSLGACASIVRGIRAGPSWKR